MKISKWQRSSLVRSIGYVIRLIFTKRISEIKRNEQNVLKEKRDFKIITFLLGLVDLNIQLVQYL